MEEEERLRERLHEMAEYQSNDFSFKDSDLERALRKQEDKSSGAALQRWRWFYVALIGITVALLSMVVNLGIAGLNSLKIKTTERIITNSGDFWRPYFLYVGLSALYALFAAGIVAFWAPEAAGSGMPEIKAYFNGVHIPGLLSLRTLISKLVSATFVLAAGLIAEGEAPFVHIGAIVGGGLTSGGSRSLTRLLKGRVEVRLPRTWGGVFRNDYDHRDFCAIGASAGVAVAFNGPISGMAFIAEESAANLGGPVYYRALMSNCAALLVFNILVAAYNDQGYFWNSRLFIMLDSSTADVLGLLYMRLWELPIVVVMSCCIGALGSLFIHLNTTIVYKIRNSLIPHDSRYRRTLEVVMIAVITGTIWFGISYGSPCAPLPTPEQQKAMYPEPLPSNIVVFITYNNFPQLWCAPGEYSLYGQVFMRPPRIMLRNLVGLNQDNAKGLLPSLLGTRVTALYAATTFAMLTITYGAGAALGVVTPVLQFGAACGLLVGHGVRAMAAHIDGAEPVSLSLYAAVGAAAFLSGCVRYKSTAVLIAMESMGAWFLVVPIAVAVFCAKAVADQFTRGIFETYLQLSCVPFLSEPMTSSSISSITNQLTVADVMARGVTALPPVIAIPELLHILTTTSYSSFPVTHEVNQARSPGHEFHVLGVIERKAILRMLQHHVGFCTSSERAESLPEQPEELTTLLARFEQRPLKVDSETDQDAIVRGLAGSGREAFLDMRPFMFRAPLLMQQGASLTRALSLFRQMGLHHILIAPPDPRAVGFVTRKDLAMENAKLARLRKRRSAAEHGEDVSANGVRKEMNGAHGMAPQELC